MSPPPTRVAQAALLMLLAGLLTLLAPAPAPADEAEDPTPLTVRLSAISPAIPERGQVVLRGVVRNDTDEEWKDLNVQPFVSTSPMTTRAELAAAAELPETTEVGDRLTEAGTFASIGDLAPGEAARFMIRLKRDELPISGRAGVYWIGVHALGLSSAGRDGTADGRARTFIPLVPKTEPRDRASVAVVLPLRNPVRRGVDGRIIDGDAWAASLGEQGRLGRILEVAEGSGGAPYTWLIDPAVLDAVADIARGNPKLSYGKAKPTPSPSPGSAASAAAPRFAITPASAKDADGWLARLSADARAHTVLGLPYADPDVVALARLRPEMLERALILSADDFGDRDLDAVPTYAPPSGFVAEELWTAHDVPLVLGADHGTEVTSRLLRQPTGGTVVVADSGAAAGGPLPTSPTDALALRQRVLAEAALRVLSGDDETLTVVLPEDWQPGPDVASAAFFRGLGRPWLNLVPLDISADATDPEATGVGYPDSERKAEIDEGQVNAARGLINTGAVLAEVLDTDNDVLPVLSGAALGATSYAARDDSSLASLVRARAGALQGQLDSVRVLGTEFNTLSSGAGRLTVTVVNDLPQAVKLGLEVDADAGLQVKPPAEPMQIGPGQRQTIRLQTVAQNIGVHDVTLTPVTDKGRPFGTPLEMTVRTSEVGRLIWYVLAVAGGIFVVMIIRRIVLRIRQHRWRPPIT